MPSYHRRSLLRRLAATSVALLGGCATSDSAPESTPTAATTTPPDTTSTTQTADPADQASPALGAGPGPLPVEAWPLSNRAASNCAFLPDGPSLSAEMTEDWRVKPTAPPEEDPIGLEFSAPVIADDKVVAANRLLFTTNAEAPDYQLVRAFDADSGEESWQYTIGSESDPAARDLPTTPAVWDDVVVIGHGEEVRAIDFEEGTEVWKRSLGTRIHAVVPADSSVYVRAHRSIIAVNGDEPPAWSTSFEEFPEQLVVGHRRLYVSVSRRVHAIDPATGKQLWTITLPAVDEGYAVKKLIAVEGGIIAVQSSGDVYAISDTGRRQWRSGTQYDSIETDGTRVYAGVAGMLRGLAVSTGERLWERSCSEVSNCDSETEFGPLVLTGDSLVVSLGDALLGVALVDGKTRWVLDDVPSSKHLALGPDALYGSSEAVLARIEASSQS